MFDSIKIKEVNQNANVRLNINILKIYFYNAILINNFQSADIQC